MFKRSWELYKRQFPTLEEVRTVKILDAFSILIFQISVMDEQDPSLPDEHLIYLPWRRAPELTSGSLAPCDPAIYRISFTFRWSLAAGVGVGGWGVGTE